jgi:3-hydroxybutyryl-CoA dehydratase
MTSPFTIGSKASFSKTVSERDVTTFAEISGDRNPLHLDEEYARQTRFGARIAHGGFTFAIISAVLGMELPGPGTVYISQNLKFLKPVFFDDTVTATVEITAIRSDKGIVTLKTDCTNQHGEKIAEGEAVVFHEKAKGG